MALKVLYDHQIFLLQKYGGISRYFATLTQASESTPAIEARIRLLYSENGYLQAQQKRMPDWMAGKVLKGYQKKLRWNRRFMEKQLHKSDFDVFHPTYYDPYFLKQVQKPVVVTVHDMIHELFPEYFSPSDPTTNHKRQTIERADHIIAISESTKADLLRFLPVSEDKITVIHHGNLQGQLTPQTPPIGSERPYLLFVGAREAYKNFYRFLQAIVLVLKAYPDHQVICFGGGDWKSAEKEAILRLGLQNQIQQVSGTDQQLAGYYQQAEAFIYPSLYEGFGLPILEAFAQHCPVILSDIACFQEVAGDAALYFDPYDAESIAEGIMTMLKSSQTAQVCKDKGYARLAQFSLDTCIEQTFEVYRRFA